MKTMYKFYGLLLAILLGSHWAAFSQCSAGTISGPAIACVGQTSAYTDAGATTGATSYTWSLSGGGATIDPVTGVLTATAPGTVTVKYTVIGACGSAFATMIVAIDTLPDPIINPGPVCDSSIAYLYDSTAGGTWTSMSPAYVDINPTTGMETGNAAGTSVIIYTFGGCSVTTLATALPLPTPIVGPDTLCRNSSATYVSTPTGGTWSSTYPVTISIGSASGFATAVRSTPLAPPATYINYVAPNGCGVYQQLYVYVTDSTDTIQGPNQVCKSNAITLYQDQLFGVWSTSSTTNTALAPSGFDCTVTGLMPSVDTIYYTRNHCPAKMHIVTVNPLPGAITGPTAICVGDSTQLADTSARGTWSSTNTRVTVSSSGFVRSSDTGASALIIYTLPTTCSTSVMVNVGIHPPPILGINSICIGDSTLLTDSDTGGIWSSTNLAVARVIDSSGEVTGYTAGVVNISYTFPNGCFTTDSFTVKSLLVPSVTISGPSGIPCFGTVDTFVAHPVNGGVAGYLWEKFSIPLHIAPDTIIRADTLIYTPTHGDVIMVFMTVDSNECATSHYVGDSIAVNVYPDMVSPLVSITTSTPDSVAYIGQIFTFHSVVSWGGTDPTYKWYINNSLINGANSPTFDTAIYHNDTIYCIVTGNAPCPFTIVLAAISNKITIYTGDVGVRSISQEAGVIDLYPNPNTGSFTLSGTLNGTADKEVNYEIMNMLGQVVYRGSIMPDNGHINEHIQSGDLASGGYVLRLSTDSGNATFHLEINK